MDYVSSASMATFQVSSAVPVPVAKDTPLYKRVTWADQIIGGAAFAGLVSAFLPAVTVSANITGTMETLSTVPVADSLLGKLGFLCFATAGTLLLLLVGKREAASRQILWILPGVCGLAPVLALWLTFRITSSLSEMPQGMGAMVMITTSIGTYTFLASAVALAIGGYLKARTSVRY